MSLPIPFSVEINILTCRQGEFGTLHNWLKSNLYQYGRKFTTAELVEQVTGGSIRVEPYLRYLDTKYSELYSL